MAIEIEIIQFMLTYYLIVLIYLLKDKINIQRTNDITFNLPP